MIDLKKPRCTCTDEFGNADIVGLEDVMPEVYGNLDFDETNMFTEALNRFRDLEVAIESGELVPVVHGRWEVMLDYPGNDGVFVCSNCKEAWILNGGTPAQNNMNYCPRCGAKMDGKDGKK